MIDPKCNIINDLKLENMNAILLSYVIWDSKFRIGNDKVSLIHNDWAYAIDGTVFDKIMIKYPRIEQCRPYDSVTSESLQFSYYNINLNMLPEDLIITSSQMERYAFDYYPYSTNTDSFLIWFAKKEEKKIGKKIIYNLNQNINQNLSENFTSRIKL